MTETDMTVDNLSGIAGLFLEYGELIVILSVFVIIILVLLGLFIKLLGNSAKMIMNQQQQLLDKLLEEDAKITEQKANIEATTPVESESEKEKKLVETFVKLNEALQDETIRLRRGLDADRVAIYVFHNGSYSSHGLPFFKLSCINERIKRSSGVYSKIAAHNALPLSLYEQLVTRLYRKGQIIYKGLEEVKHDSSMLFAELEQQEINTVFIIGIYDKSNNILGFVQVEFKPLIEDNITIDNHRDMIIKTIEKISPILEYSEFQKTLEK